MAYLHRHEFPRRWQNDRPGPASRRRRLHQVGRPGELSAARRRHAGQGHQADLGHAHRPAGVQKLGQQALGRPEQDHLPSRGGGVQPAVQDRSVDRSGRQLCAVRHPDESADVRLHCRERLVQQRGPAEVQKPDPFPPGNNPVSEDATKGIKAEPGRMGAIMLKVSYRILDPEKNKDLIDKFHTSDALIFFPGGRATKTGPACVEKKLGLVGFHVGHKTRGAPQWVWTSFEHVSNVPDAAADGSIEKKLDRYNFFNPKCTSNCPAVNDTPPQPWDPDTSLTFKGPYRSQVVRTRMLPGPVIDEVAKLNAAFQGLVKGTVWENYMLLTTQWPSSFNCVQEVQKLENAGKDLMTVVDPT